jgi:small GTP-binding protein
MLKKKICMVGHFGVGKTSLVRRFVESMFDDRYLTTVGVKIDKKDLVADGQPLTLMLWDIAGEDDLAQLKISHLRGASGYILVADGCRLATLHKAVELQQRIEGLLGALPFVVVVNKADLKDQWEIQASDLEPLAWPCFETSAKLGQGVDEMFLSLASRLIAASEAGESDA